jgi:hypothetical protein
VKFEKLEQFITESLFLNKAIWLREAEVEDLATVMPKHPEFAKAVMETIGHKGRKAINEAKIGNYDESFARLTQIEFEPMILNRLSISNNKEE